MGKTNPRSSKSWGRCTTSSTSSSCETPGRWPPIPTTQIGSTRALVPHHFWRGGDVCKNFVPMYKLAGVYGSDSTTPIHRKTWESALDSARLAWRAARLVMQPKRESEFQPPRIAYALASAPGHHSGWRRYGGNCFLNNATVAAFELRRRGAGPVGILDLDFCAGDGILEIVETAPEMAAVSIHADPRVAFPSFAGFPGATGDRGQCLSIVAPNRCDKYQYLALLRKAIEFLKKAEVRSLVIAFGADAYREDPLARGGPVRSVSPDVAFSLRAPDYYAVGRILAKRLADSMVGVVVTQEGAYAATHDSENEGVEGVVEAFFAGLTGHPPETVSRWTSEYHLPDDSWRSTIGCSIS